MNSTSIIQASLGLIGMKHLGPKLQLNLSRRELPPGKGIPLLPGGRDMPIGQKSEGTLGPEWYRKHRTAMGKSSIENERTIAIELH